MRAADGFEENEGIGRENVSILRRNKQSWIIVPGDLSK
jgi:hypothetical protein